MHLAAAAGAPVVAVFPPTVPLERWRPWRVPHVVLGDQGVPCAGCRARECPLPEQVCLDQIDAGAVEQAVEALTAGPSPAVVDLRGPDGGGPASDVPDRPVVTP
jgi:heptosyltransferase-3